jgi:biopolymer transport protein ExbD
MKKLEFAEEMAKVNFTPIIDLVTTLFLFFALSADMGQRELEEVNLPKASSIKEDKESEKGSIHRLTININHKFNIKESEDACPAYARGGVCREKGHWLVKIRGVAYPNDNELAKKLIEEANLGKKDKDTPSERPVMIRADAAAEYGMIQKVMILCVKSGFYKVEVGASIKTRETARR